MNKAREEERNFRKREEQRKQDIIIRTAKAMLEIEEGRQAVLFHDFNCKEVKGKR